MFPGSVLLAWSDPALIQSILPSNSLKKKFVKYLFHLRVFDILGPKFDGIIQFLDTSLDVNTIAKKLLGTSSDIKLNVVFFNATRDGPRAYIWGANEGKPFFIKIN